MKVVDNKRVILNYLIKERKGCKIDKICAKLGLDTNEVQRCLSELELEYLVTTKNKKYCATDYKIGQLKTNGRGDSYVTINDSKVMIPRCYLNGARCDDTVLVDVYTNNNKLEGSIINIEERDKKNLVGTVVDVNDKFYIKADRGNYLVDAKDNLVLGSKVIFLKGKLVKDNVYAGSVVETIGHVSDPKIDIFSKLAAFGIQKDFSDKAYEEVKQIPTGLSESDYKDRVDLRDREIFSIDGEDAKDLDDAVSLSKLTNGNFLLGVHIADVQHYVKENSQLDKEAYQRGNSTYTPGCVIPMLPHELSSGICSLFERVDRLTRTCDMEITPAGKIVNFSIYDSVINSKKRMTYNKANETLDDDTKTPDDYKKFENTLKSMKELKDILFTKRVREGSLDFDTNEVEVEVDDNGKPIDVCYRTRGEAQRIIEEFMLEANITVASYLQSSNLPTVYRDHDYPNDKKLNQFIFQLQSEGIISGTIPYETNEQVKLINNVLSKRKDRDVYIDLFLRTMSRANYSIYNKGHYGLGFKCYTHFTSPIRRYNDLLVHRAIKNYQSGKDFDKAYCKRRSNYLEKAAAHISMTERNSDSCEMSVKRMKMAEFMQDKIGNEYNGKIVYIEKGDCIVQLCNGIKGKIYFSSFKKMKYDENKNSIKTANTIYHLGDKLDVVVDFVDKESSRIEFKPKVLVK